MIKLHTDPLSDLQKEAIRKFVETEAGKNNYSKRKTLPLSRNHSLSKTQNVLYQFLDNCKEENKASIYNLQKAIANPKLFAKNFKINSNNFYELVATKKYLKLVLRFGEKEGKAEYSKAVANGLQIRSKEKILLFNEPAFLPNQKELSSLTPVEVILSSTYLELETEQVGEETNYKFSYLEAVSKLKEAMEALYKNSELAFLLNLLAYLIRCNEKINIIFNSEPLFYQGNIIAGEYNNHRTIFCGKISNIDKEGLSTFIHEVTHLLFNFALDNSSSPAALPSEENLLDQALEQDRLHRQNLDVDTLTAEQTIAVAVFLGLENCPVYFPNGFNPNDPVDLFTMRAEGIIKPVEFLEAGTSLETIKAICPNLWYFYDTIAKTNLWLGIKLSHSRTSHCHL